METIEEIGFGGLKIIQDSEGFRFGVDSIIIADFANTLYPDARNVCDLGTGNGIIPVVLSHKNDKCEILGIDVQQRAIELAQRNAEINGLRDRLSSLCIDVNALKEQKPQLGGRFDAVITNPPYVEAGGGLASADSAKRIARQETTADLEEFIKNAAWLLADRGHFFIVHRPARLADIFCHCRKYGLEPKHMRLVTPHEGETPNIVMVHCVRGAGRELKMMRELAVRETDGKYTREIDAIYERQKAPKR